MFVQQTNKQTHRNILYFTLSVNCYTIDTLTNKHTKTFYILLIVLIVITLSPKHINKHTETFSFIQLTPSKQTYICFTLYFGRQNFFIPLTPHTNIQTGFIL